MYLDPKVLARNLALDKLKELSLRAGKETYNIYDARPEVLERVKHHVGEHDSALDDLLIPLIDGAIRDADRVMCDPKADRTQHVQIGQLAIFADLDLDQVLKLGDNERKRLGDARFEHVQKSLRLDTDNLIAVNAAFAVKRTWKQGLLDVMEPMDPRTTVSDVVTEATEDVE